MSVFLQGERVGNLYRDGDDVKRGYFNGVLVYGKSTERFIVLGNNGAYGNYSFDGITWNNFALPTDSWQRSSYGNDRFVSITANLTISAYSYDGINWVYQSTGFSTSTQYSMVYGRGFFVVAVSGSLIYRSSDGITWNTSTLPGTHPWMGLAYGMGRFVAIANNSTNAAYSDDGITWTQTTMNSPSRRWYVAGYGNKVFVAMTGADGIGAYSYDGITWTQINLPLSSSYLAVTYGYSRFVVLPASNTNGFYSYDGVHWNVMNLPNLTGSSWNKVVYGVGGDGIGRFVATNNLSRYYMYSIDGINWTLSSLPSGGQPYYCLSYSPRLPRFVSIKYNSNQGAVSFDGIEWAPISLPLTGYWNLAVYGVGSDGVARFVVLPWIAGDVGLYSVDGIEWHTTGLPISGESYRGTCYGIVNDHGRFVALCGGSNRGIYSDDGITWISFTVSTPGVAAGHRTWIEGTFGCGSDGVGRFVVGRNLTASAVAVYGGVVYSEDGINWNDCDPITITGNASQWYVTYGAGKFVASLYGGMYAYSSDGISWTQATNVTYSLSTRQVIYGKGVYLSIAPSDSLMYSYDGDTWYLALSVLNLRNWWAITYDDLNGRFVIVENNSGTLGGYVAYSDDGLNWTESTLPSAGNWYTVTYGA